MDRIKAVREKYNMPSEDELSREIRTDFHRMEETLRKREQLLFGLNMKHQELKSKVEIVEESVATRRKMFDEKLEALHACNERLNELSVDKNTILREVHELETRRNAMKNAKPNVKDQQTLELGIKKFKYYKQLTGVRWDFGAPKGITKGYVTNGSDYVRSFNYKTEEYSSRKLEQLLWQEMEKATGRSEAAETDENKSPNNR